MIRITICAVGRLRKGPERQLVDDYLARATKTGRALGIGPITETEVEDKNSQGKLAEGLLLQDAIPQNAVILCLDERGKTLSSPQFSNKIASWRDDGHRDLALVIGGADGLAPELLQRADLAISFGAMVWPHMMVRAMVAEQIYRATTILAGTPYHRN